MQQHHSQIEAPKRDSHHQALDKSICELHTVTTRLRMLLHTIQHGVNTPEKITSAGADSVEEQSLAMVLHGSYERLDVIRNEQLDLIQAIEDELF